MEVKQILHMKNGEGENSYARSAGLVTLEVAARARHLIDKAARSMVTEHVCSCTCLNVADLGCGFGPQPLDFISTVIQSVEQKRRELKQGRVPEIQFSLNDLVGNDFNSIFKELSVVRAKHKDVSWFAGGVPGSFYGRLFPHNSLHLVYSCYSLHWLSKPPENITDETGLSLNKGKVYISKSSPPEVHKAYLSQFRQDLTSFLNYRCEELASNGRLLLIFNGSQSADNVNNEAVYFWDLLAEAASYFVSQGILEEEKLDLLNIPFYNPSLQEVEDMLENQNSFLTEFIDTIELEIGGQSMWTSPDARIKSYRSVSEAIVSNQLGKDVMDKLYEKITQLLARDMKRGREASKLVSIVVILRKKGISPLENNFNLDMTLIC